MPILAMNYSVTNSYNKAEKLLAFKNLPEQKPESNQISIKKENKTPLVVASLALVTVAGVVGVKSLRSQYFKKAQKTFQEVFMRENISKQEAIEMLKRYREIGKIKDKEKFTNAMFEEIKVNFGFKDKPIKLVFKDLSKRKSQAGCARHNGCIEIDLNKYSSTEDIASSLHHEFRHAKQHEILYNEFPEFAESYFSLFATDYTPLAKKLFREGKPLSKLSDEEIYINPKIHKYLKTLITNHITDEKIITEKIYSKHKNEVQKLIKERIGELSPKNVPEKYKDFAKKCKENHLNYVNIDTDLEKYKNQFVEIDAREAETKIMNIIKWLL